MLEDTKVAIKNRQPRDIGNRDEDKHEPSYKQLEVKKIRTSV
jgi:hypothetical protein